MSPHPAAPPPPPHPVTRSKETLAASSLAGLHGIALAAFVVAALYFASEILIPLTLAALLAFLLSPLAARLERVLGRLAAVIVMGTGIFLFVGGIGWVLSRQVMDLGTKLPNYQANIEHKVRSLRLPQGGTIRRLSEMLVELESDMLGVAANPSQPASSQPVPVQIIEAHRTAPVEQVGWISRSLFGVLGSAAIVLVLVIFLLLERESLRAKIIRLIGQSNLSATSLAIEDAGRRVSHYLITQFFVNLCFGAIVATGLYFIGIPNAVLWGALAAILRFIPYIGIWVAALFPAILSLTVSPGWGMTVLTLALFGTLEAVTSNLLEPLLYRSSTGISSVALLVAALFWTWLWGPIGLLLSTPLTVCLVVIGRHAPRLAFFSIMLGDEEIRSPAEDCYHRLLTERLTEAEEVVETYLKEHTVAALYDQVLIPALTAAEIDFRRQALDETQRETVLQGIRDLIEELEGRPPAAGVEAPPAGHGRILCLPARGMRDEIAGQMLAHLLRTQGLAAEPGVNELTVDELSAQLGQGPVETICISIIAPSTVIHARHLCAKLRARDPRVRIVVGIWGGAEKIEEAIRGLRARGADHVVVSLAEAVGLLAGTAPSGGAAQGTS